MTKRMASLLQDDAVGMLSEGKRLEALSEQEFFHDMILSGHRTGTWVYPDTMPPNYHLFPTFRYLKELSLSGATCLDIGTYDGMTAFVLSELGAKAVHGLCQFDLQRFRLARAHLSADRVIYHPSSDISHLPAMFPDDRFDLVVISAMLHHLTSPLDGILLARSAMKPGGILILEVVTNDQNDAGMQLNTAMDDPIFGAPTLWIPSRRAIEGMMELACFEQVGQTRLLGGRRARETNYERTTYIAIARRPSQLTSRSAKTVELHDSLKKLGALDLTRAEKETSESAINFAGETGKRYLSIWNDRIDVPLQPSWADPTPYKEVCIRTAREDDFARLAQQYPEGAFKPKDIHLLTAKYPAETMPEGMQWGLKQLGNLHVLDYIQRWGLRNILEVGPGFNFYFPNHLPDYCEYTALDDSGFYDQELLALAKKNLPRGRPIDGLLGRTDKLIRTSSFDACCSVSVLEHIEAEDIQSVCDDMFRILKPGGWALHSIDLPMLKVEETMERWLDGFTNCGFAIPDVDVQDTSTANSDENATVFTEARSIKMRFYHGYMPSIWGVEVPSSALQNYATVLVALRKPIISHSSIGAG